MTEIEKNYEYDMAIDLIKRIKTEETHERYIDRHKAFELAIKALEKQIPMKPIMKPYFEDMEEEYLCCPTCGEILTDRIPNENKNFYFHCLKRGQTFDWSDDK